MKTKKMVIVGLFLSTLSLLTACGTVNGFGRDVSHAGHDIQRASR